VKLITNDELDQRENENTDMLAETMSDKDEPQELNKYSISAYIDSCWTNARSAKENGAEKHILRNMRQFEGQYEADKLSAIREIGGSEVFMMITDAKCKNAFNWVSDILFQPGQKSWGIDSTPVPELSEEFKLEIVQESFAPLAEEFMMQAAMQGSPIDPASIQQFLDDRMPVIEKNIREEILAKSKELAKVMETKVDDKLTEGGWYRALKDSLHNVVIHTGVIKGPILKKRNVLKVRPDPDTGKLTPIITEELYPHYESRHPLFIYPSADSTGVNDGYLIDRVQLTPIALQDLIGVPGYHDEEIYKVLDELKSGSLKEWIQADQEKATMNDEQSPLFYDSDKVDCLEFWGAVQGEKLIDWGIIQSHDGNPIEHLLFYNVRAYKIGSHVIGILFNKHPLGHKPFYATSFENRDGSFWGKGLPEVISDVQSVCNACARAIVNNIGIASGPMVERNVDRIPSNMRADKHIIPWKVWDVTETMMSGAPALTFYQPRVITEQLLGVYNNFSKIADEHSGIPAYAHGDPNVGGAGNTASGLNMLMGGAARGIRAIVSAIDEYLIKPSIEAQYYWCISQEENKGFICDYQIVTSGSSAALIKEQMAARRLEFMRETANPIDMQILGMEGRKYLLEETARAIQLELSRVFPIRQNPNVPPLDPQAPGQGNATLDASGQPVSGQDNAQFTPQRTSGAPQPQPRAGGGPVAPGEPYLVGEQGPEVIVPDQSGQVIPNQGGPAAGPMMPTPPSPMMITDPWGDEITPGVKPKIWANLPLDDRAEDVMQVVTGARSMGPAKDEAFHKFFEAHGNDVVKTAEGLSEAMHGGHLPHFFMYESDNKAKKQ
jgi:hypothetical protein